MDGGGTPCVVGTTGRPDWKLLAGARIGGEIVVGDAFAIFNF